MGPRNDQLLTIAQAGDRMSTKKDTTYRLIYSGALEAIDLRVPGAKRPKWRIPASAIDALIAARKSKAIGGAR